MTLIEDNDLYAQIMAFMRRDNKNWPLVIAPFDNITLNRVADCDPWLERVTAKTYNIATKADIKAGTKLLLTYGTVLIAHYDSCMLDELCEGIFGPRTGNDWVDTEGRKYAAVGPDVPGCRTLMVNCAEANIAWLSNVLGRQIGRIEAYRRNFIDALCAHLWEDEKEKERIII